MEVKFKDKRPCVILKRVLKVVDAEMSSNALSVLRIRGWDHLSTNRAHVYQLDERSKKTRAENKLIGFRRPDN